MGNFIDMVLLWLIHFLQSPEGQTILAQAENELTATLDASGTDAGNQGGSPPVTQPAAPSAPVSFTAPAPSAQFNPRKRSSATNEQA